MASFHCCGTSPPVHTSTRMAWKRSRTMGSAGSSILSSSATRESGPGAFPVVHPPDCSSCLLQRWSRSKRYRISGGWCCRSLLHLLDNGWVQLGGFRVEESAEEPPPPLEDLCLVPQQNSVLVLNKLLPPRLPPAKAHRFLEVY